MLSGLVEIELNIQNPKTIVLDAGATILLKLKQETIPHDSSLVLNFMNTEHRKMQKTRAEDIRDLSGQFLKISNKKSIH